MAELTPQELQALELTRQLVAALTHIIGHGRTRERDIAEAWFHVHGIQRMIMSQVAARQYPDLLRQLGGE